MFDWNQIVKVRWNNSNRKWYENKGYKFSKRDDIFEVTAKDISPGSDVKVDVICDYCGKHYLSIFSTVYKNVSSNCKNACSKCAGAKASDVSRAKRAKKNFDCIRRICENNGYTLITKEDDFTDVKMDISYICPKHGIQTVSLDNFRVGHKCFACSYEKRFYASKLDANYVESIIDSINGNKWLNKSEYTNCMERNLKIKCKCGNTYTTSFVNFYRHGVNRCHQCSLKESSGELKIRKYLEGRGFLFEQEKRFSDCRDKKALPFDFYLPSKGICIEFDGQQHYTSKFGTKAFEQTKKHDEIKNKYCSDNNLTLIRIPYWDGNNVETILNEKLKI